MEALAFSPSTIYHSPFTSSLLNSRTNAARTRDRSAGRDARGASRASALLSRVRTCPRRLQFVLLSPLLDQFAKGDREVARGALQAVGASLQLVHAARVLARGNGDQRVLGL